MKTELSGAVLEFVWFGERRVAYTVPVLRLLVANEQTRVQEIAAAMESMGIDEITPAWRVRCDDANTRLQHFQRLLAARLLSLNPAAPLPTETPDGSLVTNPPAARPV